MRTYKEKCNLGLALPFNFSRNYSYTAYITLFGFR